MAKYGLKSNPETHFLCSAARSTEVLYSFQQWTGLGAYPELQSGCISAPPSPSTLLYPPRSSPTTLSFSFAEPRLYVNDHLITAHCYLECCLGVEFASIFRYVSIFLWTPQATITVACLSVRRFLQLFVVH